MKKILSFLIVISFALLMASKTYAVPVYWECHYGTLTDNTDMDDVYDVKHIGFYFNFYGSTYTTVGIGTNGLLVFGANDGDWCNYNHQWNWTSTGAPGAVPVIAPLWTDWNPADNGNIYYNMLGTDGDRRFVVTYEFIDHFTQETSDTFQVILFENGVIQFGWSFLDYTEVDNWGERALVGVSDGAGNITSMGEGLNFNEGTLDNQNRWFVYNGTCYRIETEPPPLPEDCIIYIIQPRDGDRVPHRPYVRGEVADANSEVRVIVHQMETSGYWVQPDVSVESDGRWEVKIYVGRSGDIDVGKHFELIAVANPTEEIEEGDILPGWPEAQCRSEIIRVIRR